MSKKILLPNNCACSALSVNPKNWKTCKKDSLNKPWQIQYYFYDPNFAKPKMVAIRGMNQYKNLDDRRAIVKSLIDDEIKALHSGYNPFLKKIIPEQTFFDSKPTKDMKFSEAIYLAANKIQGSKHHKMQIKYAINRIDVSLKKLGLSDVNVYYFKRSQLKQVLESLNLPAPTFNKYRAYLSSIYAELIEWECCENNITRDIKKKVEIKNIRESLPLELIDRILEALRLDYYDFYRYAKIFEYSVSRTSELLSVQAKHVRLFSKEYDVMIKKGKQYKWVTRPMIVNSIPYWTEILSLVKSQDDFIFSHGLVPGPVQNDSRQITIRWREHVKKKLLLKDGKVYQKCFIENSELKKYTSITADFYSIKHTVLDFIDKEKGISVAMDMSQHTKESTARIYTTGHRQRVVDGLKKISLPSVV